MLVPISAWSDLRPDDAAVHRAYARAVTGDVPDPLVIWTYRTNDVLVRVRASSAATKALDPTRVTLVATAISPGGMGARGTDSPGEPWTPDWMRTHGLSPAAPEFHPKEDGTARATLPRLRWMGIQASAAGFVTTTVSLPRSPTTPIPLELEVELTTAPRLRGVVTDGSGVPLRGAVVAVNIVQRLDRMADFDPLRDRVRGWAVHGGTLWGQDGPAVMVYTRSVTTRQDGAYEIDLATTGELTLTAHARGHVPARREMGRVLEDSTQGMSLAEVASPSAVEVRTGGLPLRNANCVLVDITSVECETSAETRCDEHGRVSTDWLVLGRDYWMIVTSASGSVDRGCLRWDGRATIDVDRLIKNLTEFEASVGKEAPPRPK